MKTLFHYLKPYKVQAVLSPLFKLLEALLELFTPLVVAAIIDKGIQNGDADYIVRHAVLLCLLAVTGFAFSVTAQYFAAKVAIGASASLRHDVLSHIHALSFSEMDKLGSSTLLTRITGDVQLVQTGINMMLRLMLRSPFVVVGAVVMATLLDARSAWIFLAVVISLSILVVLLTKISVPLFKRVQSQLDRIVQRTSENHEGARVIRAFRMEDREKASFQKENQTLIRWQTVAGRVSTLMNPLTYWIVNMGVMLLIYKGAWRVHDGGIPQGDLVALYNYMTQILVELVKFAGLIVSFNKSLAGMSRINDLLAIPTEQTGVDPVAHDIDAPVLCFDDVDFRYAGSDENALDHISFKVQQGESIGIIGGTGSGKSTLVHLLMGFYPPTGGSVLYHNQSVTDLDRHAFHHEVALVPQQAKLFKGTIRDNLLWGNRDANDDALLRAVHLAQADDVVSDKGGLDAEIEQGGVNLSGGQRQRLTIARALVRSPKVLILDDSASALDYATEARLRRALAELENTTLVFVSQRAASLRNCDKILVLEDGRAVGYGSSEELLQSCETYHEIYESQFPKEAVK